MILPLTLVAVALAILLLLLYLEGGHHGSVDRMEDLAGRTRPVDIDAFRNLMDPKEDAFLRANLRPGEFRAIQRERARSAIDYIQNATHNATCLLRLGEAAAQDADPRIARAGRQLVDSALRLRAYALLSRSQLYLRMALPGARFSYGKLADSYQRQIGESTGAHATSHSGGQTLRSALVPSALFFSFRLAMPRLFRKHEFHRSDPEKSAIAIFPELGTRPKLAITFEQIGLYSPGL